MRALAVRDGAAGHEPTSEGRHTGESGRDRRKRNRARVPSIVLKASLDASNLKAPEDFARPIDEQCGMGFQPVSGVNRSRSARFSRTCRSPSEV
jgi:hypothetical protein